MTYNEIIKALEQDKDRVVALGGLNGIPVIVYHQDVIDLINRQKAEKEALIAGQETLQRHIAEQKAEIERLTEEHKKMSAYIKGGGWGFVSFLEFAKNQRAEAVKEFLERLKGETEQALESNYKARAERMAKPNIEMADEFVSYCEGKISALRGIGDFSENLAKEMAGDG